MLEMWFITSLFHFKLLIQFVLKTCCLRRFSKLMFFDCNKEKVSSQWRVIGCVMSQPYKNIFKWGSCLICSLKTLQFEPTEVSSHRNNRNGGEYHYSSDYGHTPRLPNSATRYLRLIWDERGKTLEYTLRFNNSRRGFWISSGPQSGTMLDLPYNQFSGTIQVMKVKAFQY